MQTLEIPNTNACTTLFRADRISRIGNQWLGRFCFDQAAVERLSQSNIGLFAEGFVGLDTMFRRFLPMTIKPKDALTIVLYSTKEAGVSIFEQLVADGHCNADVRQPEQWQVGSLLFSSIEGLQHLEHRDSSIDSVILLDPTCMVYRARSLKTRRGCTHDRPQIVVNFLADHILDGVQPGFLLMTTKRAAAVPTDSIARAFCLETFWFLDGPSLVCN